jgi:hypothetical protein
MLEKHPFQNPSSKNLKIKIHKTTILSLNLYVCDETWPHTKGRIQTEGVCELCSEYLDHRRRKWLEAGEDYIMRSFYASPNIIKVIKSRRMRRMGEMRNAYKILVGKSEWGTLL